MNGLNRFLGLFHRKHRMSSQYENLSQLKRIMFLGSFSFIMCLGFSKFFFTNIVYSFQPTEENKYLIKLNPSLDNGKYKPTVFLIFGLLQRLWAKYMEDEPYLKISEQQFEGEVLNWVAVHDKATFNKNQQKKRLIPVVLVIAGSEGMDNTFKHCISAAYTLGFRTVAIDPKDLHDKDKIDRIVNYIKQKHPSCKLFGIGIQYGANLLINYASQHPKTFKGLVSIGNPLDLLKSEIHLQNSWVWKLLYYDILNARIQKAKKQNQKLKVDSVSSLFQLDKYLYNIDDENFLQWKIKNSSINSISKLQDKTLFLQSKEDPFTKIIDNDQRFQNQHCIYVTTQRGGHSEWFQNLWMSRWFVSPISNFLKLNNQQTIPKILKRSTKKQQTKPSQTA